MGDLTDRERRTLSDPQRLLWRDDVEGICPTPGVCWEYGDTTRCGPCAIKQAEKFGVESNHTLPNLPEVYRLRREARDQADEIARLREEVAAAIQLLGPFAEAADDLDDKHGDDSDIWEAPAAMSITAGHLRDARSLILQHKEPQP